MIRVWVIGYGKFGRLAVPRIRARWPRAVIWIVEQDPVKLAAGPFMPGMRVLAKGADFLWEFQDLLQPRDWIIPAIPVHLAGEWLARVLGRKHPVRKIGPPKGLGAGLPFTLYLRKDLYVSLADYACPEDCPSPRGYCFHTREKRPHRLWEILDSRFPAKGRLEVIRSRQLAPGLGGYRFEDLQQLNGLSERLAPPVYLATACPCHGVITGLTWRP